MRVALAAAAVSATLAGALPAASTDASKPVAVRQAKVDGHGARYWHAKAVEWRRAYLWQRKRARHLERRLRHLQAVKAAEPLTVEQAIRQVFGGYASQALAVARCESGLSVWARNGQYENLFQLGLSERRTYGWHTAGSPAIVAAQAAYRYFAASGFDWSPWTCKP